MPLSRRSVPTAFRNLDGVDCTSAQTRLGVDMTGFRSNSGGVAGWLAWEGDPDDDAAHQIILAWLQGLAAPGFQQDQISLSNRVKGNLGEFIAYWIGKTFVFTNVTISPSANAWEPLSDISRPDIDIIWLYFGDTEASDWAALQEVKTTEEASLQLADSLITDDEKLFGENLRFTLQTRLGALKNRLDQYGQGHLSPRVTLLGGPTPQRAHGIRIVPTLLHNAAYNSQSKMVAVRQALIGRGWATDTVECWSIALGNMDHRLVRLARGQL